MPGVYDYNHNRTSVLLELGVVGPSACDIGVDVDFPGQCLYRELDGSNWRGSESRSKVLVIKEGDGLAVVAIGRWWDGI